MKSWEDLDPDEYRLLPKGGNFTPWRDGHAITFIGIHHNAGNLSIQQIYNVWLNRAASAHYQVDTLGRIGQLVHDRDGAWALADWTANMRSINIEHANNRIGTNDANTWTVNEAVLDNGAHLVAALCKFYNLGRPVWRQNVIPHNNFISTTCPGALAGSQNSEYMNKARTYYDEMMGRVNQPVIPQTGTVTFANYPFVANGWDRFGDINGGPNLHGGDSRYDGDHIRECISSIQLWLCMNGFVDIDMSQWSNWCDGLFEQPTIDAVTRFQKAHMPGTTYYGEVWHDDYTFMKNHNPLK